jgi:hypothetical protein
MKRTTNNGGNAPKVQNTTTTDVQSVIDEVVAQVSLDAKEGVEVLDEEGHKKTAGRPIDPNSPRQKRLIELEVKKLLGQGKRGRPVDTGSDRQQRLAAMEERKAANGGVIQPGRPPMSEEDKKKAATERKKLQDARAKQVAEIAKAKLIEAGLMTKDGKLIEKPITA